MGREDEETDQAIGAYIAESFVDDHLENSARQLLAAMDRIPEQVARLIELGPVESGGGIQGMIDLANSLRESAEIIEEKAGKFIRIDTRFPYIAKAMYGGKG